MSKDQIYAEPLAHIQDFRFDEQVADVFPDMIQRSVPGYQSIIQTIGQLASRYQQDHSHFYDLGCSLGAASLAMRRHISATGCKIVAVDNSAAMVERCRRHLEAFRSDVPVEVIEGDIRSTELSNAAMVVVNFTLQFLAKSDRTALLNRVFQALKPGGILLLSEKIISPAPCSNQLLVELHHDFKRANGYSELEISQKRTALENVMQPDSIEQHQQRLQAAGFSESTVWFQCFNFCSMIAFKQPRETHERLI